MNLMRFEKLVDDLARLDGTGKYATASNIVAGDPYFAQSIEAEYGQSIADLRKLVADEEEAQAPASTRPKYSVQVERWGSNPAADYLLAEDRVLVKRLRCDLAFKLVELFRDQLGFLFDQDELTGATLRNLACYKPEYAAHLQRSLEMAKQLGFAGAMSARPKPAAPAQPAGVSVDDLRELAELIAAPGHHVSLPGRMRIEELARRLGAEVFGDPSTAGRPPLASLLASLACQLLKKVNDAR